MASAQQDSGYVDNWQAGKSVTECNLHMLTTENLSDVIFRVGSEKLVIRAHRYVLVSRSCVFHAMFCGPLAEKGEVTIPEIEHVVFKEFLRFLYTDIATITSENVTGLLYTSRKYAADALFNQCSSFIEKSISNANACQILEQCHSYGELDLEQKALTFLTNAGIEITKSSGFVDLCSSCLWKFLKSHDLNLQEDQVFEAALSWSKEKCMKESVQSSADNIRSMLAEMIYDIRFTELPLEYLSRVVGPSGILTDSERIRFVDRSFSQAVDIIPFQSGPRRKSEEVHQTEKGCPHILTRCTTICKGIKCALLCGGQYEAISFSANQNIQLLGCQLSGSQSLSESTYSLNILLYDDQDQVIAEPVPTSLRKLRGGQELNEVMFPNAIPLVAGRYYTICVRMTGSKTCRGENGQKSIEEDGVVFTFKNASENIKVKSTTTWQIGQIPGLIWI